MLTDLRLAFRSLRRTPSFTATVVATLALGIGANTAIFSVVHGILLAPSPLRDMERLAVIWQTDRAAGTVREPASIPDYADVARMTTTFERVGAFMGADVNVTPAAGDPFRVAALAVTHDVLPLLGIAPVAGRGFTAEEDRPGADRVVILSEGLWEREFGRDRALERYTIRLNDVPHAIVGVLPRSADFGVLQVLSAAAYARSFADRGRTDVDIWLPLRADPPTASRDNHPIFVVGRLAADASWDASRGEMTRIAADLERAYPSSNDARGAFVEPLEDVVFGPITPALYVLLAAVGMVLLAACVNAANLLLARSAARAREVAVRAALGGSTWRLARQFLSEGLVLSAAAAGVGVLLARWALDVLVALAPAAVPRAWNVSIDLPVLAATAGVAVLVALGVGTIPAIQARTVGIQAALGAEAGRTASAGRSRRRAQSVLVVVQVGLAVALTVGAGLLIRSFAHLRLVDPGFRADGVIKLEFQLPPVRYPQRFEDFPDWPAVRRFHDALVARAAALPGVAAAAVAGDHPLAAGFTSSFAVVGREAEARDWPEISVRRVSEGYADTVGLGLVSGRHFEATDSPEAAPVAQINEAAGRMFFQGQDPVGQQIGLWGSRRRIVGVVGDEKIHGLDRSVPPAAYLPLGQAPFGAGTLLVRVEGEPAPVISALRTVVRDIDPALAVFGVQTLRDTVDESLAERRFTMLLLGSFSALTLLLTALGVYGVLSHTVAQRTGEIGIRIALGAQPRGVRRLVMGQGLALVLAGIGVGIPGALILSALLRNLLFGVAATDPLTFAAAPAVLVVTAAAASYFPARRASTIDPLVALRIG